MPRDTESEPSTGLECEHCESQAVFWVQEQWLAEDGVGSVSRMDSVCSDCVHEASPQGLEQAYARYEFSIEPVADAFGMSEIDGGSR